MVTGCSLATRQVECNCGSEGAVVTQQKLCALDYETFYTKEFSLSKMTNEQYVSYRALMYLAEGKADSAFLWFDRVKEWGIPILISLQTSASTPMP